MVNQMAKANVIQGLAFFSERQVMDELQESLGEAGVQCYDLNEPGSYEDLRHRFAVAVIVSEAALRAADHEQLRATFRAISPEAPPQVVVTDATDSEDTYGLPENELFVQLMPATTRKALVRTICNAVRQMAVLLKNQRLEGDLQDLNRIGAALSAERDLDNLLGMILHQSRDITAADAGSLYIIEYPEGDDGPAQLRFRLSQNDSLDVSYKQFVMPLTTESMAGYVGITGRALRIDDCYHLPEDAPYGFNKRFDEEHGYRTTSMLVVPMKNINGEILGVIQLINRKRNPYAKLLDPATVEREVIPFTGYSEDLVGSLASQAAVALENSRLYEEREKLFEGFVSAAALAVEQRDPTTAGHSHRVATLSVATAERVHREGGPLADLHFDDRQLKELRYASLLHDFGKIGVRESVLVKAKKLYDERLALVRERFDFAKRTLDAETSRRKIELVSRQSEDEYRRGFKALDQEYAAELTRLDQYYNIILMANEPTVLEQESARRIADIAAHTYHDITGGEERLLDEAEVRALSIPKGSLTEHERLQIESHVTHTFQFLSRIPWTKELRGVPGIAYAHHEKLDGTGYPRKIASDQIPPQSKIMTIADIFDALTASDRPYKKAIPLERALTILGYEVNDGHVDPELFRVFTEAKVYELVL